MPPTSRDQRDVPIGSLEFEFGSELNVDNPRHTVERMATLCGASVRQRGFGRRPNPGPNASNPTPKA